MVFTTIETHAQERRLAEGPKRKFPNRRGRVIELIKQAQIEKRPSTRDFIKGNKYEGFTQSMNHHKHPEYKADIFVGYAPGTTALSAEDVLVHEEIYANGRAFIDRAYLLRKDTTIEVLDGQLKTSHVLTNNEGDRFLARHLTHVLRDVKRDMQNNPA